MSEQKTPGQQLIAAVRANDLEQVQALIAANVDINQQVNGDTALGECVHRRRYEIAKYLLAHGASPDVLDDGVAPLQMAKANGWEIFIHLLETKDIPEWSLLGTSKLAHVEVSLTLGRKLTEIFNFESRERLTCWEILKTGAETVLPLVSFNELPEAVLESALEKFTALNGVADKQYVLHGGRTLDKTKETGRRL